MSDEPSTQAKAKGPMFTLIAVAAVAIVEGGLFFAGMKIFGKGADNAYGDDKNAMEVDEDALQRTIEVELVKSYRARNTKTGRPVIYDIDVAVIVPADKNGRAIEIKDAIEANEYTIKSEMGRILRSALPRTLEEDNYNTLREQIHHALVEILGDPDMIKRVLIPRCVPIPAN